MRSRLRENNLNETQMDRNLAVMRVVFNSIIFALAICGIVGMVIFSLAHRASF